ncbi:MAG: phosphotransferase family protein [Pseudomonadota bacterium]
MSDQSAGHSVPEGIHAQRVTEWLTARIEGLAAPLRFSLIAGGHSNLTYRCEDDGGRAYVLRRPPLGHVLESAHDMGREHRIVSSLAGSAVPVADTFGLCTDVEINDAPFYVMNFVDGTVFNGPEDVAGFSNADRAGLSAHIVEILGDLHAITPDDVGLGELGRKEAYIARQLKRWTKQWEATKTHEIPEMDECLAKLQDIPEQVGASIVHGDYRAGNMIMAGGRVQAILDWELCTLGDPLADVGYLLNSWVQPGEEGAEETVIGMGGFWSREQLVEAYSEKTGRDLSRIDYYRGFSHWRLAAIGQGVYKRYLVGAMGDDQDVDLEKMKEGVALRARAALAFLA